MVTKESFNAAAQPKISHYERQHYSCEILEIWIHIVPLNTPTMSTNAILSSVIRIPKPMTLFKEVTPLIKRTLAAVMNLLLL